MINWWLFLVVFGVLLCMFGMLLLLMNCRWVWCLKKVIMCG